MSTHPWNAREICHGKNHEGWEKAVKDWFPLLLKITWKAVHNGDILVNITWHDDTLTSICLKRHGHWSGEPEVYSFISRIEEECEKRKQEESNLEYH